MTKSPTDASLALALDALTGPIKSLELSGKGLAAALDRLTVPIESLDSQVSGEMSPTTRKRRVHAR